MSAFTGTSFSTAVINGFNEGLNLGSELQKVIETTAATIPKQVSATWLNVRLQWIDTVRSQMQGWFVKNSRLLFCFDTLVDDHSYLRCSTDSIPPAAQHICILMSWITILREGCTRRGGWWASSV